MLSTNNNLRPELRKQHLDLNREPALDDLLTVIKNSGMKVNALADKAGVAPTTIGKWLDGTTLHPRISTLSAVARVFGYKLELVLDRSH